MARGFTQHHLYRFEKFKKQICLIVSGAGFTLIELLIVIAVIGILAVQAFVLLNPVEQLQKAWDVRRKSDLAEVQKALEKFYQDNGRYPDSINYKIKSLSTGNIPVDWGNAWLPYLGVLPKDPKSSKKYVYSSSSGQAYYLYASLDRGAKDSQVCRPDGAKCDNAPVSGCGANYICNYGISSPNVSP